MKRISLIIAIVLTGIISSCTKSNAVKPTGIKIHNQLGDKGDLGTADGE